MKRLLMMVMAVTVLTAWDTTYPANDASEGATRGMWTQIEGRADCFAWDYLDNPSEGMTWSGDCLNGKIDGYGRLTWKYTENGARQDITYLGTVKAGKMHGRGQVMFADGEKYDGDLLDGVAHGQGAYFYRDGTSFSGDWKNGCFKGRPQSVSGAGS